MIKRSFRIGLLLGLLGGVVFALVKVFGRDSARSATDAAAEPWPPLEPSTPSPALATAPPTPVVPATTPEPERPASDEGTPWTTEDMPLVDSEAAADPLGFDDDLVEAPEDLAAGLVEALAAADAEDDAPTILDVEPVEEPEPAVEPAPAAKKAATRTTKAPAKAAQAAKATKKATKAPAKAAKKATKRARAPKRVWVEPTDGACPTSHPVKAKLASAIYHLPGMLNYERTRPDRCYADAAGAEADGLRAAKR